MRFVRVVIILFAISIFLVGGTAYYFYQQYPPEKIRGLAQSWLSEQIHHNVQIRSGSFKPLQGFQVNGIQVYRLPPNDNEIFIQSEGIQFRYSWRDLLQRRLKITELILERPHFTFYPEEFVAPPAPSTAESVIVVPPKPSPLTVAIQRLEIREGSFSFYSNTESESLNVAISRIQFALQNAELLQNAGQNFWQNLNYQSLETVIDGQIQFAFPPTDLSFGTGEQVRRLTVAGKCHADIQSSKSELSAATAETVHDSTALKGKLQIRDLTCRVDWANKSHLYSLLLLPAVQLQWQGWLEGDLRQGAVSFDFALADWLRAKVQGQLQQNRSPQLLISAEAVQANLTAITGDLKKWDVINNSQLNKLDLSGQVIVDSLVFTSDYYDSSRTLDFLITSRLQNLAASERNSEVRLAGMNGAIQSQCQLTNGQFRHGELRALFTVDSLLAGDQPNPRFLARNAKLDCETRFGNNWLPETVLLAFDAEDIFGAVLHAGVDFHGSGAESLSQMDFHSLDGTAEFRLTGIDLAQLTNTAALGLADVHLLMSTQTDGAPKLTAELNVRDLSVEFDSTTGLELLPDLHARLTGLLTSSPGFREIQFKDSQFELNDLAKSRITVNLRPPVGTASIYFEELKLNLPAWEEYFPMYLREEMTAALWKGEAVISSELSLWSEADGKISSQWIGDLHIDNEMFDNPFWYLRLDSLTLTGTFGGDLAEQQLDLEGKLARFQIVDSTPIVQQTSLHATLGLKDWNQIKIQNLLVEQPQWQMRLNLQGSIDSLATVPAYSLNGSVETQADSITQLLQGIYCRGDWSARVSIFSLEQQPSILHLRGWVNLDTVDVLVEGGMMLHGLRGRLPFSQLYNLNTGYLEPVASTEHSDFFLNWFDLYEPFLARTASDYNLLTADSLYFANYKAEDLQLFLRYDKGNIIIPRLSLKLYEGDLLTRAWLNFNSGALADISYQLRGQLSRVNSALLPGVLKQKRDQSRIGVTFDLLGKGVDPASKIDLEGDLEVTEIGAQTTDNLLRSIDPSGTDASIRSVKQLIKLGYKPKSLSFQIQHDHFYPQILFTQPWYSPVHIAGGKVAISRLPVKFILNLLAASAGSY